MLIDSFAKRDFNLLRPSQPEEFWNCPRDVMLRRVLNRLHAGSPSRINVFEGPYGCMKTSVAYYHGMWSSCAALEMDGRPCGRCYECQYVLTGSGSWRANFHEVDGSDKDAHEAIFRAFDKTYYGMDLYTQIQTRRKAQRPATILIDEAQRITGKYQDALLKFLERQQEPIVIFATTELEKIDGGILSRAGSAVFRFGYPTIEEIAIHLPKIAAAMGGSLAPSAAAKIATLAERRPRDCKSVLQELMIDNPHVTDETVYAVYGHDPKFQISAGRCPSDS